jgi:hypothetical protein
MASSSITRGWTFGHVVFDDVPLADAQAVRTQVVDGAETC